MSERSGRFDDLACLFRFDPTGKAAAGAADRLSLRVILGGADPGNNLSEPEMQDEWGALHQSVFGFNVFPYASVFLENDGKMGGEIGERTARMYAAAAFFPTGGEAPDHIITQLEYCAFQSNNSDAVNDSLARFLDREMLSWVPAFAFAVYRQTDGYYAELLTALLKVLIDERAFTEAKFERPRPGSEKAREDVSSVRDLAGHFTTAVRCGMFLSRNDISELARNVRVPAGFGSRQQMLTTLFDSSRTYSKENELTALLDTMCRTEATNWLAAAEDADVDALTFWSRVWASRLEHSQRLLQDTTELT